MAGVSTKRLRRASGWCWPRAELCAEPAARGGKGVTAGHLAHVQGRLELASECGGGRGREVRGGALPAAQAEAAVGEGAHALQVERPSPAAKAGPSRPANLSYPATMTDHPLQLIPTSTSSILESHRMPIGLSPRRPKAAHSGQTRPARPAGPPARPSRVSAYRGNARLTSRFRNSRLNSAHIHTGVSFLP